jgi:hypothetical protein
VLRDHDPARGWPQSGDADFARNRSPSLIGGAFTSMNTTLVLKCVQPRNEPAGDPSLAQEHARYIGVHDAATFDRTTLPGGGSHGFHASSGEAGPCGFGLQRALTAREVPCDVIAGVDSPPRRQSREDGRARTDCAIEPRRLPGLLTTVFPYQTSQALETRRAHPVPHQ